MVRPGRDRLTGWVEVDETYLGGLEEGAAGRGVEDKALIVIAAQADGKGIGRIRLRMIQDASAASLHPFVERLHRARQHRAHRWLARLRRLAEEEIRSRSDADPGPAQRSLNPSAAGALGRLAPEAVAGRYTPRCHVTRPPTVLPR